MRNKLAVNAQSQEGSRNHRKVIVFNTFPFHYLFLYIKVLMDVVSI